MPAPQVCAIFGFCDIRNFTDATEVLQEDIMEFVNSIARIVHMEVSLHGGFPNKNIGDAFLLVRLSLFVSAGFCWVIEAHSRSGQASRCMLCRLGW
jgi:class 3 adenylate cyclase